LIFKRIILDYLSRPKIIICVLKNGEEKQKLRCDYRRIIRDAILLVLRVEKGGCRQEMGKRQRNGFSSRGSRKNHVSFKTLSLAWQYPFGIAKLKNGKIINLCYFKLLNLW
jgi:hypothetical protein